MRKMVPIWAVIVVLVAALGLWVALSDVKVKLSVQIGQERPRVLGQWFDGIRWQVASDLIRSLYVKADGLQGLDGFRAWPHADRCTRS